MNFSGACASRNMATRGNTARRPIGVVRVLVFFALAVALAGCEKPAEPVAPSIKSVKTMTVHSRAQDMIRFFSGQVASSNTAVLSFPVAGTVSDIAVHVGDQVTQGQVLATLDARPLALEVDAAQADLRKAESVLTEQSGTLRRNQELLGKGFIGEAAIEQSESAVIAARSDVAFRRSRLAKARLTLADAEMRAPFDGVIGERFIEPNEEIAAGAKVMTVHGETQLEVKISVPENSIARISAGTPAKLSFSAVPGQTFKGTVRETGRVAGAGNVYPVTISLDEAPGNLRAGMTAEVGLAIRGKPGEADGFLVPVAAIRAGSEADKAHVFVFDTESGTARMTPVDVLSVRDNDSVVTGVADGDRIIIAGVAFLSDGQQVKRMASAPR